MDDFNITSPTPQQDNSFSLTISDFLNRAPNHRQVLADSRFSVAPGDIDGWVEKKDLPELSKRVNIMDFIWNHYCNCKCS